MRSWLKKPLMLWQNLCMLVMFLALSLAAPRQAKAFAGWPPQMQQVVNAQMRWNEMQLGREAHIAVTKSICAKVINTWRYEKHGKPVVTLTFANGEYMTLRGSPRVALDESYCIIYKESKANGKILLDISTKGSCITGAGIT